LQLEPFVDLGDLLTLAVERGAKIINLSWGTPIDGSYDHGSLSVDKFVYEHPDVLVVVAAGNDGKEDPRSGELAFNTLGTPASAKNVLTVGASSTDRKDPAFHKTWSEFRPQKFSQPLALLSLVAGDPDLHAATSSLGPTDFDSIKPDLLAPGTFILSARSATARGTIFWDSLDAYNGHYAYLGGTSMAAPVITGLAAVVRQYLRVELGLNNPSAALLKAVLIASAKKLPNFPGAMPTNTQAQIGYPDFEHGFGRVDILNVLPHAGAAPRRKLLLDDIPNNAPEALESRAPIGSSRKASRIYRIRVVLNPSEPLRIVLVWTDVPGNGIQNNLQLEVRSSSGNYVGNASHLFRKDPVFDDKNVDGFPFDKRNNVEQVLIGADNLKSGEYLIHVIAQNTPSPPQGYSLCVSGEVELDALEVVR
jgi:hypothetical protein